MQIRKLRSRLKLDKTYTIYKINTPKGEKLVIQRDCMTYPRDKRKVCCGLIYIDKEGINAAHGWNDWGIKSLRKPLTALFANKAVADDILTKDDIIGNPLPVFIVDGGENEQK